jgi:hypothetical protein
MKCFRILFLKNESTDFDFEKMENIADLLELKIQIWCCLNQIRVEYFTQVYEPIPQ